jgi:hypothetical protein
MTIYEHTMPTLLIWLCVVGAALLSAFTYWLFIKRDVLTAVMIVIRFLFLGLLAWCLFLPGERKSHTLQHKSRFIVLFDTSKSMLLSAPKIPVSRWATASEAMTQRWTSVLSESCDADWYPFAGEVGKKMSASEAGALSPDGNATLLRDALKKTTSRYAGLEVTGCLLLTDGNDTREIYSDWAAEPRPFPIYTLAMEKDAVWDEEPDVRVETVNTPRRVTAGWQTELKAVVSGQGTKGQALNVQLYKDGALLQELPTQIPAGGGSKEVTFSLEHSAVGINTYRIFVPPLPKEVRTNDNEYVVSVQVVDAKNRLLYVEGPPRWESKYLTRVLRESQQITPVIFLRGAQGKFMTFGVQGAATPDMKEAQLSLFKMVILGNLTGEELGEERAQNLGKFVEMGGSIVLLGGSKGWDENGFAATSLKKLLPAKRFAHKPMAGEFTLGLTEQGRGHPAFAGDPALWDKIPPVLSLYPDVAPAPAARVLVAARTDRGTYPLILTQEYGQGKVVAIFTDSLWKWQLSPEDAKNRPYQRFWNQLISWLSPKNEKTAEKDLEVFVDKEQVFVGEELEVSARWSGIAQPPPGAKLSAEITDPDKRTIRYAMSRQNADAADAKSPGLYSYKFKTDQSGQFSVTASSEIAGRRVASEPMLFSVKPYTPESLPRPVNNAVLKAVAEASGGECFQSVDELNQKLSALKVKHAEQEVSEFHTLWQRGIILGVLIALLAVEWLVRKLRCLP